MPWRLLCKALQTHHSLGYLLSQSVTCPAFTGQEIRPRHLLRPGLSQGASLGPPAPCPSESFRQRTAHELRLGVAARGSVYRACRGRVTPPSPDRSGRAGAAAIPQVHGQRLTPVAELSNVAPIH